MFGLTDWIFLIPTLSFTVRMSDVFAMSHDPVPPASSDDAVSPQKQILHDLRNSLYVIRSGLEVLQSTGPATESTQTLISAMRDEETKASQLLQQYQELTSDRNA